LLPLQQQVLNLLPQPPRLQRLHLLKNLKFSLNSSG
jgi:hypothetical protein